MHTVELLEEAIKTAHSLGYSVRQDWLGGSGGACEIKGKRWLFVDLSLPPLEQLDQVLSAIRLVSNDRTLMAATVRRALETRKAA
jgi:hypothetical protein